MMVGEVGTQRSHDILQNLACLLMSSREAENNVPAPLSWKVWHHCAMYHGHVQDWYKDGSKSSWYTIISITHWLLFQEMHRNCWWNTTPWERRRSCCRHWAFNKLMEVEWNYHKSNYSMTTLNDRRDNQRDLPVYKWPSEVKGVHCVQDHFTLLKVAICNFNRRTHLARELSEMVQVLNRLDHE